MRRQQVLQTGILVILVTLFLVGCGTASTTSESEAAAAATLAAAEATRASAKATEAAAVAEIAQATQSAEVIEEIPTPPVSSPTPEPTETSVPTPTFTPGPSPTPTTQGVGSLKGKILWASGEPRPGFEEIFIKENDEGEEIELTVVSDINGEYHLDNIPIGEYELGSYRPSGFGFYTPEFINVQEGQITEVPTRYFLKEDFEITSPTEYAEVNTPFTVTWKSYPNAVFYEVILWKADDPTKRIEEHTQDMTFTIEDSLSPGEYFLTVSAFNSEREMSFKRIGVKIK
jgi:hypothetical protein